MSRISPEILAAQQAYAARPFAARLRTQRCSTTCRFDTLAEAVAYLRAQALRVGRVGYGGNPMNDDCVDFDVSVIVAPEGELTMADVGIVAEVQGPCVRDHVIIR